MTKRTKTSSFGSKDRTSHDSSIFYDSSLYRGLSKKKITDSSVNKIPKKHINKIILGSSENMKEIPDNSVDLMITSPPYNVSKEYDQDLPLKEYLEFLNNVFSETFRVLINGGRACINVANIGRKPYIPISDYVSKMMIDIGFNMRGEIIWNKSASAGTSVAWGSWKSASNPILRDIHEYILIFSKGEYGRKISLEEKEVRKDTISKDNFMAWTKSIWEMKAEKARKIGHPAPFPIELPYRLIQLYSFTNDVVLDPFGGSFTTPKVAAELDRIGVGIEMGKKLFKPAIIKRLKAIEPDMFKKKVKYKEFDLSKEKKLNKQL